MFGKVGILAFADGLVNRCLSNMSPLEVHGLYLCEHYAALGLGNEFKDSSNEAIIAHLAERRKSVCTH